MMDILYFINMIFDNYWIGAFLTFAFYIINGAITLKEITVGHVIYSAFAGALWLGFLWMFCIYTIIDMDIPISRISGVVLYKRKEK